MYTFPDEIYTIADRFSDHMYAILDDTSTNLDLYGTDFFAPPTPLPND